MTPTDGDGGVGRALVDSEGRVMRHLRVSLTDRCNLRCRYCIPAEGLDWLPPGEILTDDEILRLIGIAVEHFGVTDVRLTGGEPLLRAGLERIVAAVVRMRTGSGAAPRVSLTTNGLGLARRAEGLVAAGLERVNVSLDTLDPGRYADLARRDRLADVHAGLAAARAAGLDPIKINSVLIRGVNDDEACGLLHWAIAHGYQLRFIEQMPLGPADAWAPDTVVGAQEILDRLSTEFALVPADDASRGSAPAQPWRVDGSEARVGIIASVSWPFCASCDRVRLTADGHVRNCLFADQETDLRSMLRAGASDDEIARCWTGSVRIKAASHGIGGAGFVQPARTMSAIGG